jgi:hypothetical protein
VAEGIAFPAGESFTTIDTAVCDKPRWLAKVRRVTGLSFSWVLWLLNGPIPRAELNAISRCEVITGKDWKTHLIDVQ